MKDGSHGSWSGRTSTRSCVYYYSLVRTIYYFDLRGLWCVSTTRAPLGRVRIGLAHGQSQQKVRRNISRLSHHGLHGLVRGVFEAEPRAALREVQPESAGSMRRVLAWVPRWPFSQRAATTDRCRRYHSCKLSSLFLIPLTSPQHLFHSSQLPQPPTHSGAVDAFQILPKQQSDILSLLAPGTERVPHP